MEVMNHKYLRAVTRFYNPWLTRVRNPKLSHPHLYSHVLVMHDNFMIDGVADPLCNICPGSHKQKDPWRPRSKKSHCWVTRDQTARKTRRHRGWKRYYLLLSHIRVRLGNLNSASRAFTHIGGAPTEAFFSTRTHWRVLGHKEGRISFFSVELFIYICVCEAAVVQFILSLYLTFLRCRRLFYCIIFVSPRAQILLQNSHSKHAPPHRTHIEQRKHWK